jgi:hypothetical protein
MSQLGELINRMAVQSGIDANNEGLVALLSNVAVSTYDIPDAIAASMGANLMTLDSAKNNPTIKSHFKAEVYNGLDTEVNSLMADLGLPADVITELGMEKSSTKRVSLLTKKVKEIEASKVAADGGNTIELTNQINALNQTIATEKTGRVEFEAGLKTQYQGEKKDLLVGNMLSAYDYAMPISKEANVMTASSLVATELSQQGLKVVLDDNNNLQLLTEAGTEHFDNNAKVDVRGFMDSTLGKHKLLQAKPAGGTPPSTTPPVTPTPAGATPPPSSDAFSQAATEAAQQFEEN